MNSHAEKPIAQSVRQGETIKIPIYGSILQEITCNDIARLALAMHDHSHFFSLRRGLSFDFRRDLNGSGTQGLYIRRKCNEKNPSCLFEVFFDYTYDKDGEFLYEADLLKDGRKDYDPTVNMGKHRFVAKSAQIWIDWNSGEAQQWRSDIERLSRSPNALTDWIEAGLEMRVSCVSSYYCRNFEILTIKDLRQYVAAGISLEDLKNRLTCSQCGKRGACVTAF